MEKEEEKVEFCLSEVAKNAQVLYNHSQCNIQSQDCEASNIKKLSVNDKKQSQEEYQTDKDEFVYSLTTIEPDKKEKEDKEDYTVYSNTPSNYNTIEQLKTIKQDIIGQLKTKNQYNEIKLIINLLEILEASYLNLQATQYELKIQRLELEQKYNELFYNLQDMFERIEKLEHKVEQFQSHKK